MGERKGQNKYYPPDFDPEKHGNLNKYHGTHALRERASKIHLGILTIRFEMPFNIWCLGCERHVAMGVRYNAEKKKVGNYYTTPIYEFRMKCHLCDNYYVIRTDPKNFDYELVEGCRRQEKRWEPSENGQGHLEPLHAVRKAARALATDAMYKLEHGEKDKLKSKEAKPELEQIEMIQDRMCDDYMANRLLRDAFRGKRNELKAQAAADTQLRQKASLPADLKLVALTDEDRRMAAMLARHSVVTSFEERAREQREALTSESIFAPRRHARVSGGEASSSRLASESPGLATSSSSSSSGDGAGHHLSFTRSPADKLRRRIAVARQTEHTDRLSKELSALHGSVRVRTSAKRRDCGATPNRTDTAAKRSHMDGASKTSGAICDEIDLSQSTDTDGSISDSSRAPDSDVTHDQRDIASNVTSACEVQRQPEQPVNVATVLPDALLSASVATQQHDVVSSPAPDHSNFSRTDKSRNAVTHLPFITDDTSVTSLSHCNNVTNHLPASAASSATLTSSDSIHQEIAHTPASTTSTVISSTVEGGRTDNDNSKSATVTTDNTSAANAPDVADAANSKRTAAVAPVVSVQSSSLVGVDGQSATEETDINRWTDTAVMCAGMRTRPAALVQYDSDSWSSGSNQDESD